MASRDYDDLLESFMNNSAKVYSKDKETLSTDENKVPSAYNLNNTRSKKTKSVKRGRIIEKKNSKKAKNKRMKDMNSPKMKVFRFFMGILMIIGVVAVVCISVMGIYAYSVIHGDAVFDLNEQKYAQNQTSFIYGYDKNNKEVELTRLHGDENRIWVNLDDVSEYLPKAVISIEDKRFKSHHGVDWIRTIGVIVKMKNLGQGGSTITQQLIKNLTDENQVTIARKFNEILSALNLERHFKKDEILEAYLNTIYLSEGCYGVKTAAEVYFGKDVSDLNIAECACLVGITQYPTQYDPLLNTAENKKRQKEVLKAMLEEEAITQEQYDEAIAYELIFTNSEKYKGSQVSSNSGGSKTNVVDSWYIDYVIKTVMEDLQNQGYTERKAKALVYGGGLKIYTAIDFEVQEALEDVYENYKGIYEKGAQSAMVVMDYKGRVLGLVGGLGEKNNVLGFNRAVDAKRQPGSSFKPLAVYAPAFEKSLKEPDFDYYWSTLIKDAPTEDIKDDDGKPWPTNEGRTYSSKKLTVQSAISRSLNTISARTLLQIGLDYSYNFLTEKFHISSLVDQDCNAAPLATGALTIGASVLDITAAYQTFGNGGEYYYPYCYYKVTDFQGNTILESNPEITKERALSESTAWLMNKLLQTVMVSGTGTTFKVPSVQCIGKTGTTTGSKDRYFVGGTPEYIAAVWFGYDKQQQVMQSPSPAGTLWKNVMTEIYNSKGVNETSFPEYDGITRRAYDPSNGLLANYSSGNYGWYAKDNLPSYSKSTGTTAAPTTSVATSANAEKTTKQNKTTEPNNTTKQSKTTENKNTDQ